MDHPPRGYRVLGYVSATVSIFEHAVSSPPSPMDVPPTPCRLRISAEALIALRSHLFEQHNGKTDTQFIYGFRAHTLILELTTQDLFTLVSSMITAVALGITAGLGFKFARYRKPAQRAFSVTMGLGAYYVFCIGFSHGGGGRHFPLLYACTQLLSGYIGPLLYFFCASVADPLRQPNRWYLLAGVPGTLYALILLTQPGGAEFLAHWVAHGEMPAHRLAVPLFMIHSLGLMGFALWSYGLVLREWWRARPGEHRRACGWLVAALTSVVLTLVVANLLPVLGLVSLIPFSSLILIPVAAMAYRALGIESHAAMHQDSSEGDRLLARVESMGRVGKALVHDINNMLTAIVCHAELGLLKKDNIADITEHFREIQAIGTRAGSMHDRLISFSAQGAKQSVMSQPNRVLEEALSAIRPQLGDSIELKTHIDPGLPVVNADSNDLHRAVTNLLLNAIEAIDETQGRVTITARSERVAVIPGDAIGRTLDGRPAVLLEIADNGCGMDTKTADQLFEPFFSTKGNKRGLGLLSVMAVVRDAHGAISFDSAPGEGCVFRLWLPIAETVADAPLETASQAPIRTALVVDDDDAVRGSLEDVLSHCGVEVDTAIDGLDALQRIERSATPYDLALIDVRMPRMNGLELLDRLNGQNRPRRIVVVSGDTNRSQIDALRADGVHFERKPLNPSQLCTSLGLEVSESGS